MFSIVLSLSVTLESSASAAPKTAVRMVYLLGFGSCFHTFTGPAEQFMNTPAPGVDKSVILGCFDRGIYGHITDTVEHLKIYRFDATGMSNSAYEEMDAESAAEEMAYHLDQEAKSLEAQGVSMPMRLFVAGHSHGGWEAMRLAAYVGQYPRLKIENLVTIDPISYNLCYSTSYLWHVLNITLEELSGIPDDCSKAPEDLLSWGPNIEAATGSNWTNFYQSNLSYLHSGPVPSATWNIDMPNEAGTNDWVGHRSIVHDQRIWQGFFARYQYFLNRI